MLPDYKRFVIFELGIVISRLVVILSDHFYALLIKYIINKYTRSSIPIIIRYKGMGKVKNEKIRLLTKAITKKIPETVLTRVVVLGTLRLIPKVNTSEIESKMKLPIHKSSLFSLL